MQTTPGQPDAPRVLSLSVRPQPEREFIVKRQEDGSYTARKRPIASARASCGSRASATGRCSRAASPRGAPSAAMIEFIRALSYDVDFQRELKVGMKFTVLLEQLVTSDGQVTHPGTPAGRRAASRQAHGDGDPLPAAGRRRPVLQPQGRERGSLLPAHADGCLENDVALRPARAPILGYSAMHTGVDFGAPSGTPILAAGAGKVTMAGYNGGYGIFVKLEHTREIGTGYGHMSRLGPGIKPGVAVRQGQVIGFVGSTGMSTGPHLHYEFYRGGRAVNPLAQKFAMQAVGRRQGSGALQGPGRPVSGATEERAQSPGQQARGQERRGRPANRARRLGKERAA